jgi:hypothetical protein
MRGARRRAGLEQSAHVFQGRHVDRGLQAQAGHASIETTQVAPHERLARQRVSQGRRSHRHQVIAVSAPDADPLLAATMLAYLAQITVSRPSTVRATEADLRILAGFLIDHDLEWCWRHPDLTSRRSSCGSKESSFRRRMSVLRMFFIRIVEWDWDDAPARVPILFGDVPKRVTADSSTTATTPSSCVPSLTNPPCFVVSVSSCSQPGCASVNSATSRRTQSRS